MRRVSLWKRSHGIRESGEYKSSHSEEPRGFIKWVRHITRRKFILEEKIRIVLEGFRHEIPIRDLCCRGGIRPNAYYAWLRDFMEAGKEKLARDTVRDTTRIELAELKR